MNKYPLISFVDTQSQSQPICNRLLHMCPAWLPKPGIIPNICHTIYSLIKLPNESDPTVPFEIYFWSRGFENSLARCSCLSAWCYSLQQQPQLPSQGQHLYTQVMLTTM